MGAVRLWFVVEKSVSAMLEKERFRRARAVGKRGVKIWTPHAIFVVHGFSSPKRNPKMWLNSDARINIDRRLGERARCMCLRL